LQKPIFSDNLKDVEKGGFSAMDFLFFVYNLYKGLEVKNGFRGKKGCDQRRF